MTDSPARRQPPSEAPALRSADAPATEFRTLFDAEVSYMRNTLRRLGVREADLDDAVVEAFVAVHRHFGEYEPARPVRPWLFGFALRVASNQRRKARHRREVLAGQPDAQDAAQPPDEALAAGQLRRRVIAALDELDLDRRAVLVLHDLDGQSMPEIAAALAIPLNTAYSRLRLAREQFAAAMRRIEARRGPA